MILKFDSTWGTSLSLSAGSNDKLKFFFDSMGVDTWLFLVGE